MAVYMYNNSLVFGEPPRGEDGQLILTGDALKQAVTAAVNHLCYLRLRESDWVVTRQLESNVEIPAALSALRTALRARANQLTAAIAAASTDEAVLAVEVMFSDLQA